LYTQLKGIPFKMMDILSFDLIGLPKRGMGKMRQLSLTIKNYLGKNAG
jgi:hypothetical protein